MTISEKAWTAYIRRLSAIDSRAAADMRAFVDRHGFGDEKALIDYAFGLTTKYGEGASALAAQMYDAIAELSGIVLPPAIPAETASYGEVARTVRSVTNVSQNADSVSGAVGRMVRCAGADTMIKNAERDGAEFAWIPSGDTCPFCLTLAARGWTRASSKYLKSGHAEHIHSHCDCTYSVRHSPRDGVAGYDPGKYKAVYEAADGTTPRQKINSMRREQYAENADEINAQKRAAYALRTEKEEQT